jgi:hypothetical protein
MAIRHRKAMLTRRHMAAHLQPNLPMFNFNGLKIKVL